MKTKSLALAFSCYVYSFAMPILFAQDCSIFVKKDTLRTVTWEGVGVFPNGNGLEVCGFKPGFGVHEFIAKITDHDGMNAQPIRVDIFPNFLPSLDNFEPSCATDARFDLPILETQMGANVFHPLGLVGLVTLTFIPDLGQCASESSKEGLDSVNAGSDTLICGLSYQLVGSPIGGNWDILCPPSGGVVAFENQDTASTWVTVNNCGDYTFVYYAEEENISQADTVVVTFDVQPSSQSVADLDISLVYNNIECHSPNPNCSNTMTISGFEPPSVSWEFCMSNTCSSQSLSALVGDVMADCIVDTIAVDTIQNSTTLSDCSSPSDVNAETLIDILNNLADGLGCTLPLPSDCQIERPECPDTLIFDTITLYIPIHEGGQWHYLNDNNSLEILQDTSNIVVDGMDYQFIIAPNSAYYGPSDLTFTIFELDANNHLAELTQNVNLSIQWQELWSTDTLVIVDSFYVALEDTCYACGGHVVDPAVINIPPPPTYPCGPLDLNFGVSSSDQFENYVLSCNDNCVFTSVGEICSPGTYVFEEIDENGCPFSIFIDIFIDDEIPNANIFQIGTMTCDSPQVILDGSASSIGSHYFYQWNTTNGHIVDGENDLIATVDAAGDYVLSVFNVNNGCENSAFINVQNETIPTAITLEIAINCSNENELIEVCAGHVVSLNDISNPYPCQDENGCPTEITVFLTEDLTTPIIDNIQTVCNENNTAYTVTFEVSGTADYTIESMHQFEEIPSCENYEFIITGSNGCSTIIDGSHCCDCTTQAGEFSDISILSCNDCVAMIYLEESQILDENDIIKFLLHTEAAPMMGEILATNDEPIFCFDDTSMSYHTAYYITAWVGNDDGNNNISPNDNCADFSTSLAITWSNTATVTELNETICAGNCMDYADSTLCEMGTYIFIFENSLGCDSMVSLTLTLAEEMQLDWTSEAACFNDSNGRISIDHVVGGTPPYLYSKDGENFQTDKLFNDLTAGQQMIYVQDSEGCILTLSVEVPVIPAIALIGNTTTHICGSEAAILDASPSNLDSMTVTYIWQDGSTKATFSAPVASTYWVDVTSICQTIRQEFKVTNDFIPLEQRIYVPNAFSPNGDEENDFFKPYTNLELVNYEFNIFDRWGNLLYQSKNIEEEGWNGLFENISMNPAVMVWWLKADAVSCSGEMQHVFMKGDVTLVR